MRGASEYRDQDVQKYVAGVGGAGNKADGWILLILTAPLVIFGVQVLSL